MVNHKNTWFLPYAHLHICSTCLRLDVSSMTEIHYLQIEPSKNGADTNESMVLKMFYLYVLSDEQSALDELQKKTICSFIRFLSFQFNEFL